MRSSLRKSLAASSILSSSVAAIAVGSAGSAQAANSGDSGSFLGISNGSGDISFTSHTLHIGGSVTDAAFSPDGSHVAYIDGNGQLAVADVLRNDVRELTHSTANRSHPTWEDGGSEIVFAEGPAGASKLMSVDANGLTLGQPTVETPVAETANDNGSDTLPDANFRPWNPYSPSTRALSELVYQHQDASGTHVMILDRNMRGPQAVKLVDGTDPAVAPDGHAVAFVDPASYQIDTVALPVPVDSQGNPAPVITHVTNEPMPGFSHLTWSPDGKTIAAEGMLVHQGPAPQEPKDVVTVPAAGGTPTVVSSTPGIPAYQPLNPKNVDRVAGSDRLGTAIAASRAVWPTPGSNPNAGTANCVVLSRSDQFADALGGSALAEHFSGPLLLTQSAGLNPATRAEIARVLGTPNAQTPKTVYLLGGEQALSPAVFNAVKALGYNVQRIGGADRFATSVAVADKVTNGNAPQAVFVATGENFADALSAGAAASQPITGRPFGYGSVIVLTNDKTMPSATAAYLNRTAHNGSASSVPVYAIGGQADAALRTVGFSTGGAKQFTPVWGADRYATSLLVAKDFFDGPTKVGFATGLNWTDALSGGALMGRLRAPLLLTDPKTGPSPDVTTWLHRTAPQLTSALIFGGDVAVAPSVNDEVRQAITGPAGTSLVTNQTNLY